MTIDKALIRSLVKSHPHSASLLKAFLPLLEAQNALVQELPELVPPSLDRDAFAQGKAWFSIRSEDPAILLDEPFVRSAPKKIAQAIANGLPNLKDEARTLGKMLTDNPHLCRELVFLHLAGRANKIKSWAKKHAQHAETAALFAAHLAATAARRFARVAAQSELPAWSQGHCPLCGSPAHATCLRGKEGQRFLQCSLCRHEWRFSRSVCPVCAQESIQDLLVFHLEDKPEERAEACDKCKRYLLGLDQRALAENVPLELIVLCMLPLDIMMQEKGYVPASYAD